MKNDTKKTATEKDIVNKQKKANKPTIINGIPLTDLSEISTNKEVLLTETVKDSTSQDIVLKTDKNKDSKKPKQKNGWVTFGLVLSIIAFILSIYNFIAKLSFLVVALYYVVLVLAVILTFFTLLANENFNNLLNGGETLSQISSALNVVIPYTASIAGVFAISSIIMLSLQKKYKGGKKVLGIVFSSISIAITIIVLVLHYYDFS